MSDRKNYQYNDHVIKVGRHKILTNAPQALGENIEKFKPSQYRNDRPLASKF